MRDPLEASPSPGSRRDLPLRFRRMRGEDLGRVMEIENAAFALQKGQVSPIVKTQFGYHIIKRLE